MWKEKRELQRIRIALRKPMIVHIYRMVPRGPGTGVVVSIVTSYIS